MVNENTEYIELDKDEKIYLIERLKELEDLIKYNKVMDNQEKAILIACLDNNVCRYAELFMSQGNDNIEFCLNLRKKLRLL